ncbi:metallophosphoesterase [Paenibacillus larvae]|uniref:metallophosphoesterase family protein n=1 Tax=Paenibacillus larvae TaxID=1464 RepID=UPI002DBFDF15|nr:metallophosphoesterase [Paenibacillus larvae]MEC0188047.1 metallophosphoesterase [Paenibacillus larvae]
MNKVEQLNETQSDRVLQALVITSDPQYPWTPKMDDGDNSESDSETQSVSERLIREQYENINSYTDSVPNSSVLINGDITAFGHDYQRYKMRDKLLPILKKPYYYGLGNHDIENNKNDCFADQCFFWTMSDFFTHVKHRKNIEFDYTETPWRRGSFYYAVDFGDIYSIQLNNYPTMETSSETIWGSIEMKPDLNWLEWQLQYAIQAGKIIIVNVHKPDDWKGGPNERFKKLLKDYDVAAVFCGHYHKQCGRKYQYSDYFGDVPVFLSGSASQRTYLILEQTAKEINIYSVRDNNWKNKKLEASIKISFPNPIPSFTSVMDTDGNPVIAGQKYVVRVIDSRKKYNHTYWYQSSDISANWVNLSYKIKGVSTYKFDGSGVVYENEAHKMLVTGDGRYLRYQNYNFWYPNGGMYLGENYGSINFTLKKAKRGYNLIADDGPLFADQGNTGSMITNEDKGNYFTVEFIKQ